ncbi:MAG TPA: phosphatidylserine decarboxylase family protein [Allosphingosinicella sp.]|jgi:phosphatidylserine decarboxylase|nr:phosphatidylserine decarboxylase family protein [Allosphingosinicella sp.]
MDEELEKKLDARYRSHFGYLAGYLPKDRKIVDAWQRDLKRQLETAKADGTTKPRGPAVQAMADLIARDGVVRMYVEQMIEEQPADKKLASSVEDMLASLDHIVTTAPEYTPGPSQGNAFPMSNLFTYMMMTPAGEALFRNAAFNVALTGVLKDWCAFLDSPASRYVLNEGETGWLCRPAYWYNKLYDFEIPDPSDPHWGWPSFNAFFHREIKPECRPVAEPDNPRVIVSPNDGTVYNMADNVQPTAQFWLKAEPYSLFNMLDGHYVDRFAGGSVFQSYLSGADYHRWRSPIDGIVRHARVVEGLTFSDAESAGYDDTAATYSQGYETAVNTRGLVFIESPDSTIGMVCVIPVGITEISSVRISVKEGDKVRKGDELGYFSYGGSSMAIVFQPGAIDRFTVPGRPAGNDPDSGPPIRVNAQIAIAR